VTAVRVALSGLAGIFVSLLALYLVFLARAGDLQAASGQHGAVGIDVFSVLPRIFLWPWFWIIAISSFALFFAASRLSSRALRVLLFWTPTLVLSTMELTFFSLIAYLWLHSGKG